MDTHLAQDLVALSFIPAGAQSIGSVGEAAAGVTARVYGLYNIHTLLIL